MDCKSSLLNLLNEPQHVDKSVELLTKYVDIIRKQNVELAQLRATIKQLQSDLAALHSQINKSN